MAKTFHGRIDDTLDALIILEACRQGVLPKINRRLLAAERGELKDSSIVAKEEPELLSSYSRSTIPSLSTPISLETNPRAPAPASPSTSTTVLPSPSLISPGSVFVFDEEESGICRWTDGRIWSPSRICGNFLVYRELFRKLTSEKCLTPKEKAKMKDGSGLKDKVLKEKVEKENLVVLGCMKGTFVLKKDGLIKKTICVKGINLPLPLELENRPMQQTRTRRSKRASWAWPRGSSEAGVQHLVCYEKPGELEGLHRPREYAELLHLPLSKTFIMMQKYRNGIHILPIAPEALPIEPSDEYITSSRVVEARSVAKDERIASKSKARKGRRKSTLVTCDSESEHEIESSGDEFSDATGSPKKLFDMTTIPGHPYPTRAQNRQLRQAEQMQIQQQQLHRTLSSSSILSLASKRKARRKRQASFTLMPSKAAEAKLSGKVASPLLHAIPGSSSPKADDDLVVHGYKTKERAWRLLPNGAGLQADFTMSHGPLHYENIPRTGQEPGPVRKMLPFRGRQTLQIEQYEERVLLTGLSSNELSESNAHGVDYELRNSERKSDFTESEKIDAERNYQVPRCESTNLLGSQTHHHIGGEFENRGKREDQSLRFGEVSHAWWVKCLVLFQRLFVVIPLTLTSELL
ncbi:hypothetical protein BGZ58_006162 [Dissophora ornata]|nr:hypothetical protein BGZ58_006162 [Dissophora ornata]